MDGSDCLNKRDHHVICLQITQYEEEVIGAPKIHRDSIITRHRPGFVVALGETAFGTLTGFSDIALHPADPPARKTLTGTTRPERLIHITATLHESVLLSTLRSFPHTKSDSQAGRSTVQTLYSHDTERPTLSRDLRHLR